MAWTIAPEPILSRKVEFGRGNCYHRVELAGVMTMQSVFAHLILDVRNVERSISFYRDRLGMSVKKTDEWDGHHLAYLTSDEFELLLLEQPTRDQSPGLQRGGGIVMNFRVQNLTGLAAQLKRNSVQVLRDLEEPAYGDRTILVTDPDGYAVLLSEPVGTYH